MQKSILYFSVGTIISFVINYLMFNSENLFLDIYYAVAFGSAWGLAYFLDTPEFTLPKKFAISFGAMAVLVLIGTLIFDLKLALPSIMKFATVFVAYYLIASLKESKSLRK